MILPIKIIYFRPLIMGVIKKIISGDKKAFEGFYTETHAKLYSFIYSRTNNEYLAQEILQNAYITLWEKRLTIKPEKYYFEAYLFKIVRNAIIAEYKRKITEKQAELHFEQLRANNNDTETLAVKGIAVNGIKVETVLNNLPKRQRQVFQLIKLEGLSYLEAANELQISKRTIESHLRDAILNLRKMF